jgi:hypothetical protein
MSCEGTLSSTPFCTRCTLGASVGLFSAVISVGAISVRITNQNNTKETPDKKSWCLEAVFAILALILNCINVGFATSPGGPGAEIGNIFLSAWLGVVVSLVISLRLEIGLTPRLTRSEGEELEDQHANYMMDGNSNVKEQYTNKTHQVKRNIHRGNDKKGYKSPSSSRQTKQQAQSSCNSSDTSCPINVSPGPKRVFISKAVDNDVSSSDSSSSSSSSGSSTSLSESLANTTDLQRLDTSGDRTSGGKTTSTYSLPAPPPIRLDSSSEDHNLSRPSLSPTLNSLNGGQVSSQAMSKTSTSSRSPPPPPYNAYGFTYELGSPMDRPDEMSIEEGAADDDSAIEICVDHPDDVSSLGVSMISLGNSGHSNVDPDGYKSEDNYKESPHASKSKRTMSSKSRGSRVKRLMSDELPTVEEQSYSTQSKIESSTADETAEQVMNLGKKVEEGSFSRLDSGNASSVGPITVDESVK